MVDYWSAPVMNKASCSSELTFGHFILYLSSLLTAASLVYMLKVVQSVATAPHRLVFRVF